VALSGGHLPGPNDNRPDYCSCFTSLIKKPARLNENTQMKILQKIGAILAHYLSKPREGNTQFATSSPGKLSGYLRPVDSGNN
jgi:hypothetical protein